MANGFSLAEIQNPVELDQSDQWVFSSRNSKSYHVGPKWPTDFSIAQFENPVGWDQSGQSCKSINTEYTIKHVQ